MWILLEKGRNTAHYQSFKKLQKISLYNISSGAMKAEGRPSEASIIFFLIWIFDWLTIKVWNLQVRFWREKWNEILQVIFKHCTVKYYNWNWSNNVINWICQLIWKGVTLWHCLRLDFLLRKLILTRCEVLWCSAEIQFSKSDITENNTIINIAMPTL